MVTVSLPTLLSDGLRALMSSAPWATLRLKPFAGCKIALSMGGLNFPLCIDTDGFLVLSATQSERADLSIHIPLGVLPLLLTDQAAAMRELHLEGNSGLAAEIGFLAKNFRPDLEELLSRVLGDILAHRVVQSARTGQAWAQDSLRRLSESMAEFATEEAHLIASRSGLQRFSSEVARLVQDVERLERRMTGRG